MYCDVVAVVTCENWLIRVSYALRLFRIAVSCRRAGRIIAASTLGPRHSQFISNDIEYRVVSWHLAGRAASETSKYSVGITSKR